MERICELDEATFQTMRTSLGAKERQLLDNFRGPEGREKEEVFRESLRADGEPGEESAPKGGFAESFSMIDEALQQATMNSLAEVRARRGAGCWQKEVAHRIRCKKILKQWKNCAIRKAAASVETDIR